MEYGELCELTHLRHELRRFSVQGGQAQEASTLINRMATLAARDPAERAAVEPELERWRFRLGL
jgi:hypothetical protein